MGYGRHERPGKGETDVWLTPPDIIEALGPFDLDPCAAHFLAWRPWETAAESWTWGGLDRPWPSEKLMWVNPPYSEVGIWVSRLADQGNGLALIFARTETKWFQAVAMRATAIFFPSGRFVFHRAEGTPGDGNAGAPSVFLAFGSTAAIRLKNSGLPGFFALPTAFEVVCAATPAPSSKEE